ncbi:XRE family transcriptional regulator (plasmid) [Anabaenopsis circularis NIES-21]|uniref:XRE family transcriptional regulator n=1 Tax=Anabaenopsis circularis NIES-21 TaxID=1085406 RepID=A0A1Z4GRK4_9CYAN|nr:helix-turn-helix transcriptional regulator [Aulosira sp. FACHB-615]BAY20110.1 XRE family transcriptional regulator [Anabaenopsis circularis NIES-21]
MPVKVRRIIKLEIDIPGLGERIKQAREASGRPVTQLAKEAGISRNYWYQLEAEAVLGGMAEETLRKIEEVLGVDLGVQFDD